MRKVEVENTGSEISVRFLELSGNSCLYDFTARYANSSIANTAINAFLHEYTNVLPFGLE